jgi:hypothetical protein
VGRHLGEDDPNLGLDHRSGESCDPEWSDRTASRLAVERRNSRAE